MRVVIYGAICVSMTLVLAACTRYPSEQPPLSAQVLPLSPGVQQISVQAVKGVKGVPGQQTLYEVSSTPDLVLDFYRSTLSKDGWKISYSETGRKVFFYWDRGCPIYNLSVIAESETTGITKIETILGSENCE